MGDVENIRIQPGHLELFLGPGQPSEGELTAEVLGPGGMRLKGFPLEWKTSHGALVLKPDDQDPTRVAVVSHEPVSATVTARDPVTGRTATASVTVYIVEGGKHV